MRLAAHFSGLLELVYNYLCVLATPLQCHAEQAKSYRKQKYKAHYTLQRSQTGKFIAW